MTSARTPNGATDRVITGLRRQIAALEAAVDALAAASSSIGAGDVTFAMLDTDVYEDVSVGAGSAAKLAQLDGDGYLHPTLIETGDTITQAYATATTTHAARTATGLTDTTGGTAGGGIAAIVGTGDDTGINNGFASILAELAEMRTDYNNSAQVLNQLVDTGQVGKKPG